MGLTYKASKLMWTNLTVWLGACLIVLYANNAQAQEPERIYTVAERFEPVLRPDGLPVGAMRLYPQVGVGGLFSDNVFADESEESDQALLAQAEAVLRSETSRYFAEFGGRVEFESFSDFDEVDSDEGRIWFTGNNDLTATNNVRLTLAYDQLTEPRTSADALGVATELTEYDVSTVAGAWRYQPSRWNLRLDGRYREFDFDDTPLSGGGLELNDDRDREIFDFGARIGYDFADAYGLFLEGRIDNADYDQTVDNDGVERSYDGYEVRLGTELKLSGLITGEFFVGYLSRDFDEPTFDESDGASYGAAIDYVVTDLVTLSIDGSRTTEPTTVGGASIITDSTVSLGIDYEVLRNLILTSEFEFSTEDFEDIAREDDNKIFSLGAEYRMNRNFWLKAGYRYWDRDISPSGTGREFTINEIIVQLSYQI